MCNSALVGEFDGNINYFQNIGSPTIPQFQEVTGAANPFNGVDVGFDSTPTLGDLDGDGDLDAPVGEFNGNINYFENIPPTVSLSPASLSQNEGNSGTTAYTYTISLDNASTETVTVNYSTNDGTAMVADDDYVDNDRILTFAAGEISKQITVNVNGDITFESNETFTLSLDGATNATINPTANRSSGTIVNDDAPPNSPPTAVDDTTTANKSLPKFIPVATLLANDSDVEGNRLSITAVSNASNGTVVLKDSGTPNNSSDDFIVFTPKFGFSGNASVEYTLSDGDGGTDIGLVRVAVGNNISGGNGRDSLSSSTETSGKMDDETISSGRNTGD